MFVAGLAVLVIVLSSGLDDVVGVDICTEEGLGEDSPCNAGLLQHGQPVREGPATHRFMANLASRPLEETGNTQRILANGRFLLLSSLDQASVLDLLQIASHLSRIGRSSVSALLPSTMLQQHNHQNITYLAYASVQRNHYQHYDDPIQELTARSSFALSNCDSILSNRSLTAQIQHGHFQLLLGDSFDPCAPILAQKLGVPYLAYESGGTLALTQGILTRHSNPLANVPAFGSSLAGETNGCMPLRSRLANVKQHIK